VWHYVHVADIRTSVLGAVNVLVFVLLQCYIRERERNVGDVESASVANSFGSVVVIKGTCYALQS
jgi:hypothetical protein